MYVHTVLDKSGYLPVQVWLKLVPELNGFKVVFSADFGPTFQMWDYITYIDEESPSGVRYVGTYSVYTVPVSTAYISLAPCTQLRTSNPQA